jgi:pyruvate formate lyase activating enzyme
VVAAWQRSGVPTIAYTYTEPGVWQDYLLASARPARREGARIVMVTNGYLTPEAVERLLPVVDGFNIDLKGDDRFYRKLCRGTFEPVVETIRRVAPHRHLEVTTMLMERFHDRETLEMLRDQLAAAGVKVWHLSRFHPAGMMRDEPPTSEEFLQEALNEVAFSGDRSIPYIYAGNTGNRRYQRTLCPECGTLCVDRAGSVILYAVHGRCPGCGHHLYGVFP